MKFAHQALDARVYPASTVSPIGGPSPRSAANKTAVHQKQNQPETNADRVEDESSGAVETPSRVRSSAPKATTRHKRNALVEGGRGPGPVARKISAIDMSSDDEIIIKMKEDGRNDREVAKYLAETGRVIYNHKTIASRYKRLTIALAAKKDKELEEGQGDWHEGEDEVLIQAVAEAEREIIRIQRTLQDQKWAIVAKKVKAKRPKTYYSNNACRQRFQKIGNGTARMISLRNGHFETRGDKHHDGENDYGELDVPDTPAGWKWMHENNISTPLPRHHRTETPDDQDADDESELDLLDPLLSRPLGLKTPPKSGQPPSALKSPSKMSRDDLRVELRARGLIREGTKQDLYARVVAARAGATDIQPSPLATNTDWTPLLANKQGDDGEKANKKRGRRQDTSAAVARRVSKKVKLIMGEGGKAAKSGKA